LQDAYQEVLKKKRAAQAEEEAQDKKKLLRTQWKLVYDDEVYGTHGLYWEKKYTETGKVPTEFTNIGETPVENYFLTNAERDVTKWSWVFDKDKKTNAWYYDNKPSSKSPTVIDSDLTKEAQTKQIEAFDLFEKRFKNQVVSKILGLKPGGSSKTMKNHMKINKKTRKNVRDYATKGGTFTSHVKRLRRTFGLKKGPSKTRRSKKSKFRHTRKQSKMNI
jgi:hypothetical protein